MPPVNFYNRAVVVLYAVCNSQPPSGMLPDLIGLFLPPLTFLYHNLQPLLHLCVCVWVVGVGVCGCVWVCVCVGVWGVCVGGVWGGVGVGVCVCVCVK